MGRGLTLILGGARSGKSSHAQQLAAERGSSVVFVATAEPSDEEMKRRISRHRTGRPTDWQTIEAPLEVAAALRAHSAKADVVLLDCLTLLTSNSMTSLPEPISEEAAEERVGAEIDALLTEYAAGDAEWIVVSNEVGLGLVPPYPLGRLYRDVLGRVNQRIAAAADRVIFMVAGLPIRIK